MEDMLEEQKDEMKPNSFNRKKRTAEIVCEVFGTSKIQKLDKDKIKQGLDKLKNETDKKGNYKYSQSYLNKMYSILREVFEQAIADNKLSTEQNPFKSKKGVKKPKSNKKTKEVKPFTRAECILFLQELNKRIRLHE